MKVEVSLLALLKNDFTAQRLPDESGKHAEGFVQGHAADLGTDSRNKTRGASNY